MYRDGAARKVLGNRDFVFGDELTRENLLKIAVTSDELREVNVYKVCVQPLDGSEFTVHVDVAACRISDLKSQIRAKARPGFYRIVPFRVRVHTITLSVHLNDPFWLQTQTGTRIQRAVLPTSAQ